MTTAFDLQFSEVNAAALRLFPGLLYQWFPGGVMHGDEYDVRNPLRDDRTRGSFRINIANGLWSDFATDLRGRSPISLYAQFFCDGSHPEAAKQIARQIGLLHDAPPDPAIARLIENLKTKPVEDKSAEAGWTQIPVSANALIPPLPAGCPAWTYFTSDGQLLGYVARIEKSDGTKRFHPVSYWRNADGIEVWRNRQFVRPLPIYNRKALHIDPQRPVLIVEGEKTADAGDALFLDMAVVSWPQGASSAPYVDLSELRGRQVGLLPDHDEPGRQAMRKIADKLLALGCSVHMGAVESHRPVGWDVADGFAAKEWADEKTAQTWLDRLQWVDQGSKPNAESALKTPKDERIEQAIERGNGKGPEYAVVPEKAEFEPFPVPALQGMADWIDSQVGISHPLVTQSITLALASLAVGRRYRSPHGGQGGLSFGLVADSIGELSDYLDVAYRILDAAGLRRLVRMTRFASDTQLYQSLEKAPAQMYLSADYGAAVALTKKQTSGAMENLLSALTAVSRGKNLQLDRSQVADPKAVIDDQPVLYQPALTVVALLAFESLTALWRSGEYGRGAVESFSYAFAYAEDQVVRGFPPEDAVPDWLIKNLQVMRGLDAQPLPGLSYGFTEVFPGGGGLFPPDEILIPSALSAADYTALLAPLDALLLAETDVRPVILAGRRRVGFMATLLAVFGGTTITADLVSYAVRYEMARFEGFKRQKHQAKQDKDQGVYEQVQAVIAKHRHQGVRESRLPAEAWGYRRLDDDGRAKLVQQMLDDGVIVRIEPTATGKAGRQPVAVLMAKAYVRRIKGESQ